MGGFSAYHVSGLGNWVNGTSFQMNQGQPGEGWLWEKDEDSLALSLSSTEMRILIGSLIYISGDEKKHL